jgi:hypothetical protein
MLVQPGFGGTRQGYRGDAAAYSTGAAQMGRADPGTRSGEPSGGQPDRGGRDDSVDTSTQTFKDRAEQFKADRKKATRALKKAGKKDKGISGFLDNFAAVKFARALKDSEFNKKRRAAFMKDLDALSKRFQTRRNINLPFNIGSFDANARTKNNLLSALLEEAQEELNITPTVPGPQKIFQDNAPTRISLSDLPKDKQEEIYDKVMDARMSGKTDAAGNLKSGFMFDAQGNIISTGNDGRDDSVIIPTTTAAVDVGDTASEEDPFAGGIGYRFFADGGMPKDAPVGGIMDIESGRQMYFLGKLVKKAKRAVSKIVKSPLGKAALIGGLGYLGATKLGGFTGIKSKLFGTALPKAIGGRDAFRGMAGKTGVPGLLAKLGLTKGFGDFGLTGKGMLALGGLGLTALPFLTGQEEEEDQMILDRGPGLNIAQIRRDAILNPGAVYGNAFRLYGNSGGRAAFQKGGDAEPVAKKTMPLLDMDGQEMDLRDNGGFVPIGRMERADDVPARLSKNEFVFTADAVRNAGGGDIDKGAEVMYNTMKNLEAGGEVSEETQGLDGARNMFQTAKRLEEVL